MPVTVVVLGPKPEIRSAVLTRVEVDRLRLHLEAPAPSIGARMVVNASERTKLSGRVLAVDEDGVVLSRDRTHATDDRSAPRVPSHVELRWQTAADPAEARRWLGGGPDPSGFAAFRGPGDLSMSGARFRCERAPPIGALLLVELTLGGRPWRALGAVRRIDADDPGAGDAVGVEFVDLPEPTFDALSDFTLRHL